jgi:tetratricopeptide (TPR) repeat protein
MDQRGLKVMISSTFRDLEQERDTVRAIIGDHQMVPLVMERKTSVPDRDILANSRKMVDDADVYVLLIGNVYYGQVLTDAGLNPKNLSVTECEFEWATTRGIPIFRFLQDDGAHPNIAARDLPEMGAGADRLAAFRARVSDGALAPRFTTLDELKTIVARSLTDWRVEQAGKATPQPPTGAPSHPPVAIPDRCFGRDADVDRLTAALTSNAAPIAVLVHGGGGIGKTTLTREVANRPAVVARYGLRRWIIELETATDRDSFDAQLLFGLGLEPVAGFPAALRLLGQGPALLLLDNLETAWERAGPAIEDRLSQLAALPGLALLASFRGQDAVGGPRWSLRHPVLPLDPGDARALFRDIDDTISDSDPDLPWLLGELGGVPLAITLTARRAFGAFDLSSLRAAWERLGIGVAVWRGAEPGRLTSVPHSIELSLDSPRMDAAGRRLFAFLGQCPAGLTRADTRTLMGLGAEVSASAGEQALRLVGLVETRGDRLDLLPPVRDHASRFHAPSDMDRQAWCRHFLDRARVEGAKIYRDDGAEALATLTAEVPNIDAALRAAPTLGQRKRAVVSLNGVHRLFSASGAGSPAVLDDMARACQAADDPFGEAECRFWHGMIAFDRSDHDGARVRFEEALLLYRRVGAVQGEANCIKGLGNIELRRADYDGARVRYEEALPVYRRVGDVLGEANCNHSLGDIALRRSDPDGARVRYKEALPLYRRMGDVLGEANCIQRLGDIALRESDHDGARMRYEEALPVYRRVGAVHGEAHCIRSLGDIALARSDPEGARVRHEEALALLRRVGDVQGEAVCVASLGRVSAALGDAAGAKGRAEAALALFQSIHSGRNIAIAHEDLAAVTQGAERAEHAAAAVTAWRSMGLENQAVRVQRRFRTLPEAC